jgi:hypothetical protein
MMHVDEFIDRRKTDSYASWFFSLHRLPATLQFKFAEFIEQYQLYCTYEGLRHRVTGASRMGDVWITRDFKQSEGYQKRVNIDDCSDWGANP